jgi:hypothetical protein
MKYPSSYASKEVVAMTAEQALTLAAVSAEEWIITFEIPCDRRRRLIEVPSSADLVRVAEEAMSAAASSRMPRPTLIQAIERPGGYRAEAKIPVTEEAFDQLFNGRSGYRANYYLSPERGARFSRAIVASLIPAILHASGCDRQFMEQSLRGKYSKIWVAGDGQAFLDAPPALQPERWRIYWEGKESALGLRVPLPPPPQIDVKGTFIHSATHDEWLPEIKKDRDNDIHEKWVSLSLTWLMIAVCHQAQGWTRSPHGALFFRASTIFGDRYSGKLATEVTEGDTHFMRKDGYSQMHRLSPEVD